MRKRIILFLIVLCTLLGISFTRIFPIKIISVNPETKVEMEEVVYVNLYEEYTYQNIEYEHFTLDSIDISLRAFSTYKPEYIPNKYTITYIDGKDIITQDYSYGENVKLILQNEENHPYQNPMGYEDEEGNLYLKSYIKKPCTNITLYSKWQGKTYNIFYDGELGDTYRYGEGKTKLKQPTKSGYTFDGWYLNGNKITSLRNDVHDDIYLESKWSKIVYSNNYSYTKPAYWTINYIVVHDHDQLQPMIDKGYVCYFMGNTLWAHNPGAFSWLPRTSVGDTVYVNGVKYTVINKFMKTFAEVDYGQWYQPGDLALVTCYGGGMNRLIVSLEK